MDPAWDPPVRAGKASTRPRAIIRAFFFLSFVPSGVMDELRSLLAEAHRMCARPRFSYTTNGPSEEQIILPAARWLVEE